MFKTVVIGVLGILLLAYMAVLGSFTLVTRRTAANTQFDESLCNTIECPPHTEPCKVLACYNTQEYGERCLESANTSLVCITTGTSLTFSVPNITECDVDEFAQAVFDLVATEYNVTVETIEPIQLNCTANTMIVEFHVRDFPGEPGSATPIVDAVRAQFFNVTSPFYLTIAEFAENGTLILSGPARAYIPTLAPTVSPTASPSTSPTLSPTVSPSTSPTVSPSTSPTVSPSTSPTVSPSTSPTVAPSVSPTVSPSASPVTPPPTPSPTPV